MGRSELTIRRELVIRFWSKVEITKGHWLWTASLRRGLVSGSKSYNSHGGFRYHRKIEYAHRIAWEITAGKIPENMSVCHRCDIPICVRPSHLFIGSSKDNIRDMLEKNRQARGANVGTSKLIDNDIMAIKQLFDLGTRYNDLARKFGVSHRQIRRIIIGENWAHLK